MKQEVLLIIDAQNDFCHPDGALFVPGAPADLERLYSFVKRKLPDLSELYLTQDTHWRYDIAHASFWLDQQSNPLPAFTTITSTDVTTKRYLPRYESDISIAFNYLRQLEALGQRHTLWPEHCVVGQWGVQLTPVVQEIIDQFVAYHQQAPELVSKGLYPYSEHFSALSALVANPDVPSTMLQVDLVQQLLAKDRVYIAGQALSHCVAFTIKDLIRAAPQPELLKKVVLLLDCSSSVTGFDAITEEYLQQFNEAGITISNSQSIP